MDLKQLRYFIAAAEELHFQRAARRVNLSQPALSHQIKNLETELGVVLLARTRRSVELTPAGQVFLERAREALALVDTAVRETREAAGAEPGILRMGYVEYLNLRVITHSVAAYRRAHPKVEVEHHDLASAEVYAQLKEKTIDVGFGMLPVTHPALKFRKVVEGYWSVIVPRDHPLASGQDIPLERLQGEPLIMFERALNPPLYDCLIGLFEDAGVKPEIHFNTKQVQTGLNMAADGVGIFVVASYIVDPVPDGLVKLKLSGFENEISIGVAWHEDNGSKVLEDYLGELRKLI